MLKAVARVTQGNQSEIVKCDPEISAVRKDKHGCPVVSRFANLEFSSYFLTQSSFWFISLTEIMPHFKVYFSCLFQILERSKIWPSLLISPCARHVTTFYLSERLRSLGRNWRFPIDSSV